MPQIIALPMSEQAKEGYLTLVGHGLYNEKVFAEEGHKLGVQRAVQYGVLSHMKWSDPIFFGVHSGGENRKGGQVKIFGKSYISGISYNLPPEIKEKVVARLHVTSTIDAAGLENRQCGSYFAAGGVEVTDSIEEIVGIISDVCKLSKLEPRSFKYFIRGSFYKVAPEQVIESSLFRGMKKIAIPEGPKENVIKRSVIGLTDYARRTYLRKKEREALKSEKLPTEESA